MSKSSEKARSRIYWRNQGGERRAYADFRDFADVGGRREALIARGAKTATVDPILAEALVVARLGDLQECRRNKTLLGLARKATLAEFSAYHLVQKQRSGRFTTQWLESVQNHLEAAIQYFCNSGRSLPRHDVSGEAVLDGISDRDLATISVADVQRYTSWLAQRRLPRGGTLSPSSQRKYLNSLSNLYRRAISEGCVPAGHNPVIAMMDKPRDEPSRRESAWLEVHHAAILLESCRRTERDRPAAAMDPAMLHAIVATMLLTGGRPAEVLGLQVEDISFARKTVTFRPNRWRRLKTATSHRTVPLWPQLEEILRPWVHGRDIPLASGLLFPSGRGGGLVRDIRKALDDAAAAVGWRRGEVRPYAFRHTYCAARLQTLDRGHPVSPWTVAREMGHGGRALVDRIYGHLGEVRHRSEAVEYRTEQHVDVVAADPDRRDVQRVGGVG